MNKKKQTALAVAPKQSVTKLSVKSLGEDFNNFLKRLADYMSQPLSIAQKVGLYGLTKRLEDEVEAAAKQARQWALEQVTAKGQTVTEKGTKRLVINGMSIDAQPDRTGLDPKKVQGMLLAKNLAPEAGMNAVVSYTVNEEKLKLLVEKKLVTPDEYLNCHYTPSFKLMRPKPVSEEE